MKNEDEKTLITLILLVILVKNGIQVMHSGHSKCRLFTGISPHQKAWAFVKTGATENPHFNQKS